MTKDLEETLAELGPEYRAVVARLRGGEAPVMVRKAGGRKTLALGLWSSGYCRAAALAIILFLPCLFLNLSPPKNPSNFSNLPSSQPREYLLAAAATPAAIAEIVRTQQADGGWTTDFLTRRNAQALKGQSDAVAQLAYRKAVRNLRLRGML